MEEKSKISNTEWGILIAALFCIDLIQVGIDVFFVWFMGINVFINFLIDMMVGMSLPLYLQLRGESMLNPKRLFSILATFGLEMVPLVSDLPLWGLDGFFLMSLSKSDTIIKTAAKVVPVIDRTVRIAEGVNRVSNKVLGFNPKSKKSTDNAEDLNKAA